MTLPGSGTITAAMINVELGRASNAAFNINDSAVRALAGKPSGAISFADFYGKSNTPPFTSVTLSATATSGGCRSNTNVCTALCTPQITVTPVGGKAPYTYAWELVSGDLATVAAVSTDNNFRFSRGGNVGSTRTGVMRCKVTDADGVVQYSGGVTISTTHTDGRVA